jgi:hypothetical protein
MLDLNPWPAGETVPAQPISFEWMARARALIESRFQKNAPKEITYPKERSDEQ